jgi:hypothetical protein
MISKKTQPETVSDNQNAGIEVMEYIAPYGSHGDHERVLALINGVWLTEAAWENLAQEKLKMDRGTFHWMKKDLEESGCVAKFAGRYAAILVQIPVPHFNSPKNSSLP